MFEDGRLRSVLIRPASTWDDWSTDAESIHGISRDLLFLEGMPAEWVAAEMIEVLTGHDLYASAPSWDGKWLSILLREAGFPRHALRLRKSKDAFLAVAREAMGTAASGMEISILVDRVIEESRLSGSAHRALPDAMLELTRWNLIRKRAAEQTAAKH